MIGDNYFDHTAIRKLYHIGGMKLAKQMIAIFLENAPKRIESAQVASRIGDLETVERSVHSLKSSAGNIGAVSLQELANRIEQLAVKGKKNDITHLLQELQMIFYRVKDQLQQEWKDLKK